jgi:hypothetical protein
MFRSAARQLLSLALFAALVAAATATVWLYERRHSSAWQIRQLEQQRQAMEREFTRQRQQLEKEKQQLETIVQRLGEEKRVAEILVTDQQNTGGPAGGGGDRGGGDTLRTTLLFVEYARDGSPLPPKTFTIDGNTAHIDAMVIKFERDFVARNDPLRGHSIALFRRLFGEAQSPDQAYPIDEPGKIPDIYRGPKEQADRNVQLASFEQELWQNFWRLAEDKGYRQAKGVRVANGQGLWGPFASDRLYTLTLDADGGLNLSSEPLKGIYREAIKQRVTRSE